MWKRNLIFSLWIVTSVTILVNFVYSVSIRRVIDVRTETKPVIVNNGDMNITGKITFKAE